jgi:hypothetical protein
LGEDKARDKNSKMRVDGHCSTSTLLSAGFYCCPARS